MSLMNRITHFGKSPQGRGLMSQVQERLTGGSKTKSRRSGGRRATTRRPVNRAGRGRRTR
jgi:hypothetical protein